MQIEHQCPQCGAPAVLDETDRLFACEFCRVKSYLLSKGYFRYVFPVKKNLEPHNLIYVPYWWFKGTLFFCLASGIENKFVDQSFQAVRSDYFPPNVGLRSQALKLNFLTSKIKGTFLKPDISLSQVLQIFEKRLIGNIKGQIFFKQYIGEAISLIYSPFYINNKLFDAVTDKAVSRVLPQDFSISDFSTQKAESKINFFPALCPNCGWDLKGEKNSLVLNCSNCDTAWQSSQGQLKKISFTVLRMDEPAAAFLPFWKIRAEISGIELNSYADLIEKANIVKNILPEYKDQKLYFWCPAFKLQHKHFLRLENSLTRSQPGEEKQTIHSFQNSKVTSVTLPVSEAIESIKICMADFLKPKKQYYPILKQIQVIPESYKLVYIPFTESVHEFYNPLLKLAVNKNRLKLSYNL